MSKYTKKFTVIKFLRFVMCAIMNLSIITAALVFTIAILFKITTFIWLLIV